MKGERCHDTADITIKSSPGATEIHGLLSVWRDEEPFAPLGETILVAAIPPPLV